MPELVLARLLARPLARSGAPGRAQRAAPVWDQGLNALRW